jgi:hypothetical protein
LRAKSPGVPHASHLVHRDCAQWRGRSPSSSPDVAGFWLGDLAGPSFHMRKHRGSLPGFAGGFHRPPRVRKLGPGSAREDADFLAAGFPRQPFAVANRRYRGASIPTVRSSTTLKPVEHRPQGVSDKAAQRFLEQFNSTMSSWHQKVWRRFALVEPRSLGRGPETPHATMTEPSKKSPCKHCSRTRWGQKSVAGAFENRQAFPGHVENKVKRRLEDDQVVFHREDENQPATPPRAVRLKT